MHHRLVSSYEAMWLRRWKTISHADHYKFFPKKKKKKVPCDKSLKIAFGVQYVKEGCRCRCRNRYLWYVMILAVIRLIMARWKTILRRAVGKVKSNLVCVYVCTYVYCMYVYYALRCPARWRVQASCSAGKLFWEVSFCVPWDKHTAVFFSPFSLCVPFSACSCSNLPSQFSYKQNK